MDWYSVGIAAACGAVAGMVGAVVSFATKNKKGNQIIQTVVTVVLFSVLYAVANNTLIPNHKKEAALAQFESEILDNPAFEALKEYEPEAMAKIRAYLDRAIDESHDPLIVQTNTRQILSDVLASRIGKASDSAVLEIAELLIDQMSILSQRQDDSCFRFLHPTVAGGIDATEVFSEELMARDYRSTASILSTYDANRAEPDETRAQDVFNPIIKSVVDEYGESAVAQLNNVTSPETDRALVCTVTLGLISAIANRPPEESVLVFRWMFNQR